MDDSIPFPPEFDQLAILTDDALWRVARTKLNKDVRTRMEALLYKQQSDRLANDELAEAERLADLFDHTVLIRAKAAVLLKMRGYDISNLGPNPS